MLRPPSSEKELFWKSLNKGKPKSRLIAVGRIGRVHGVRGALKIYPYGESLGEQIAGSELYLKGDARGGKGTVLTVVDLRRQNRLYIGRFQEIADTEDAEKLVGEDLFLPEERLSPTSEGEYYYFQLIGLRVETRAGRPLGEITGIIETAGNDVYVVRRQDEEVLIPAVEEVVLEVNLELGLMIVDPPEGLIDDL